MKRRNSQALHPGNTCARVLLALALLSGSACSRDSDIEPSTTDEPDPSSADRDAGKDGSKAPAPANDDNQGSDRDGDDGLDVADDDDTPTPTGRTDAGASKLDAGGKRDAAAPSASDAAPPSTPTSPDAAVASSECKVGPVPDDVRATLKLSPFYKKYVNANGITITSSEKPVDRALELACLLLNEMVGKRPDVRDAIVKNKAHFAIVAAAEKTTDIPEYSDLPDYYNTRARGLGGILGLCAEESILCDKAKDRWYGESICVHEYAHTVSIYGMYTADPTFEKRLKEAFSASKAAGLWTNTYAAENEQEYWAEGVQNWYNTNLAANPPNGVHGPIRTKDGLMKTDPALYKLVSELVPDEVKWPDCYRRP